MEWSGRIVAVAAALALVALGAPASEPRLRAEPVRAAAPVRVEPEATWEITAHLIGTSLVDLDNDGRADFLRLHIGLGIDRIATYALQVSVYTGYGGIASAYRAQPFPAGNVTVDMDLSGIAISRFDQDGPWYIGFDADRLEWSNTQVYNALWTTPAYTRSQFDSLPVARLTVNATFLPCTGTDCGPILGAYDPSNGFVYWADPNSRDLLLLYNGTFEVLVYGGNPTTVVREVTMGGDAVLPLAIAAGPVDSVNQTFDFANASEAHVTTRYTWYGQAPQLRWWADLFGNHDGVANATELEMIQGFFLPYGLGPSFPVTVDGRSMAVVNASRATVQGAAPVASAAPIREAGSSILALPTAAAENTTHNLTLRLPWIGPYYNATYVVSFPAGIPTSVTVACPGRLDAVGANAWSFAAGTPTAPNECGSSFVGRGVDARLSFLLWPAPGGLDIVVLLAVGALGLAGVAIAVFIVPRRRRSAPPGEGSGSPPTLPPTPPPN